MTTDEQLAEDLESGLGDELSNFAAGTGSAAPRTHAASAAAINAPYGRSRRVPITSAGNHPGYEELHRILDLAMHQAAVGKGYERHATGFVGFMAWHEQPILVNARQVGPGGLAQQVMKKAGESVMMASRSEFEAAKAEALGVIVYAAALYKLYEEMQGAAAGD